MNVKMRPSSIFYCSEEKKQETVPSLAADETRLCSGPLLHRSTQVPPSQSTHSLIELYAQPQTTHTTTSSRRFVVRTSSTTSLRVQTRPADSTRAASRSLS